MLTHPARAPRAASEGTHMPRQDRVYSEADAATKLGAIRGWMIVDGWLTRRYTTDGWGTTLMLVNAIGFFAEAADHHPDLTVAWSSVTVRLRTHSADGITDKDLELAKKIEEVALWRPPGGQATGLAGTPRPFVRGDPAH
jgi:4a-hydroxytetrahydrobiopterin dehydratase